MKALSDVNPAAETMALKITTAAEKHCIKPKLFARLSSPVTFSHPFAAGVNRLISLGLQQHEQASQLSFSYCSTKPPSHLATDYSTLTAEYFY